MSSVTRVGIRRALPLGLTLLLAPLGSIPSVGAESGPQPLESGFREEVTTRRHLVDVVVVDRKGRPVQDLGVSDFLVTVDGEPREVRSVDRGAADWAAFSRSGPTAGASMTQVPSPAPGPTRWITIVLDADRVPLNYREATLRAASGLLEQHGGPDSRFSIVLLKGGRAELLQPFAAADDIRPGLLDDPALLLGVSTELAVRARDLVERMSSCPPTAVRLETCLRHAADEFLHETNAENARGLEALRGVVTSLAPLPGRKALVWLSGGFVLRPADIVLDAVQAVSHRGFERLYNRLQDPPADRFDELLDEATRSRVSVFALRSGRDLGSSFIGADRSHSYPESVRAGFNPYRTASRSAEESLRVAAESTGGRAVLTPLTRKATSDLFQTLDGVYTLGIEAAGGDGSHSRLRVRSTVKGRRIRFIDRLRRPGPGARPLIGKLTIESDGHDDSVARVDLQPTSVVAAGDETLAVRRAAVYFRVLDVRSAQLAERYEIVEFHGDPAPDEALVHRIPFTAPPGPHRVELTVVDLTGRGRGSFSTAVAASRARR